MPVALACIGVLLLLSSFRDFVFTDFQPPGWLVVLNSAGLLVIIVAGVFAALERIPPRFSNTVLFLCTIAVSLKPSVIVVIDSTPGTLVLATVVFIAGLIFLSLPYLLISQIFTMTFWLLVVFQNITSLQYFATLIMGVIAGGLGFWLQRNRISQMHHNYELENRVESLETIIPMCAACKKTRDEQGEWMTVEDYIEAQGANQVSHGVCPDCKQSLYGDYLENRGSA